MKIIKNIANRNDRIYGNNNKRKYITIHETDNTNNGADAIAHGKLQARGNPRNASWHYTVDDKQVVQSFEHSAQCWHAGDGREQGNLNSIAIEICVNQDGNFDKAVDNAVELTKQIMKTENISIDNVVQHNKWSGKNCPRNLRKSGWNDYINALKGEEKPPAPKPKPKPKPSTSKPKPKPKKEKLVIDGYFGPKTISALQRYFGTPVDGYLSNPSMVIKALQKFLGTPIYGYISET